MLADYVGKRFRLVGMTGPWFTVKRAYLAAGFIPSIIGETATHRTHARVVDVVWEG